MTLEYPLYYETFRCLAAACPDSCCKEWAVDVDEESAAFYRGLEGELGDRLRQVLKDTRWGVQMQIEGGRCPMWRQDGLCRIQAELGHDALCKTCREFPRLRHDYGELVELDLELSCPEAARLILSAADSRTVSRQESGAGEPDYDAGAMALLRQSRQAVLDFLDGAEYPVGQTLAVILLHAHTVQAALDGGELQPLEPRQCLAEAWGYAGEGNMASILEFFSGLEILTPGWKRRLETQPQPIRWSRELRALARYMIRRYWLQAVSDLDLVCRAKLTVTACLVVGALGGNAVETAQLFSKEIENDPDNIEAILDGAYTAPALTDANLLSLLLS